MWMIASPGIAFHDFAQIGGMIDPALSPLLAMVAGGGTVVIFLLFVNEEFKRR